MRKSIASAIVVICLIISSTYPALSEDLPWPMYANDYGGTRYSPRTPFENPWTEPVVNEEVLKRKLGLEEISTLSGGSGSFLLIGPDDILLFPVSGGERRYLVAYDPEGNIEPWYRPIPTRIYPGPGHVPAISPDGTVYTYSEEGELVGVNIYTGEIVWKPKCEELLPSPWNAFCRMDQQVGISTLGSILISHSGDLVTNYKGLPVYLNSNRELKGIWLEGLKGGQGAYYPSSASALDSSGNLYVFAAQWEKKNSDTSAPLNSTAIALSPSFEEKWRSEIPDLKHGPTTTDVSLVVGQKKVFVYAADEGRTATVTCLDSSSGEVKWQKTLPCISAGYSRPAMSRPVLASDPISSFYVLHTTYEGLKLSSINIEDGSMNWQITLSESFEPNDSYQMAMANQTIYAGTDRGLLQVAAPSGAIYPCVIPAYGIKSMAVNEKGSLYLFGDTGKVGISGNYGLIARTTPNSEPVISSFEADIEKYDERRNKVWVDYKLELKDPLGWNRNLIEKISYGDGDTRKGKMYVFRSKVGEKETERIDIREWSHSYEMDELEEEIINPKYELCVENCEAFVSSASTTLRLVKPVIKGFEVDRSKAFSGLTDLLFSAESIIEGQSNGRGLVYRWDMGDGTVLSGSRVNHIFESAGYYDVKLTVFERGSKITTSRTLRVEVSDPPVLEIDYRPEKRVTGGLKYYFEGEFIEPPDAEWRLDWYLDGEKVGSGRSVSCDLFFSEGGQIKGLLTITGHPEVKSEDTVYISSEQLENDAGYLNVEVTLPIKIEGEAFFSEGLGELRLEIENLSDSALHGLKLNFIEKDEKLMFRDDLPVELGDLGPEQRAQFEYELTSVINYHPTLTALVYNRDGGSESDISIQVEKIDYTEEDADKVGSRASDDPWQNSENANSFAAWIDAWETFTEEHIGFDLNYKRYLMVDYFAEEKSLLNVVDGGGDFILLEQPLTDFSPGGEAIQKINIYTAAKMGCNSRYLDPYSRAYMKVMREEFDSDANPYWQDIYYWEKVVENSGIDEYEPDNELEDGSVLWSGSFVNQNRPAERYKVELYSETRAHKDKHKRKVYEFYVGQWHPNISAFGNYQPSFLYYLSRKRNDMYNATFNALDDIFTADSSSSDLDGSLTYLVNRVTDYYLGPPAMEVANYSSALAGIYPELYKEISKSVKFTVASGGVEFFSAVVELVAAYEWADSFLNEFLDNAVAQAFHESYLAEAAASHLNYAKETLENLIEKTSQQMEILEKAFQRWPYRSMEEIYDDYLTLLREERETLGGSTCSGCEENNYGLVWTSVSAGNSYHAGWLTNESLQGTGSATGSGSSAAEDLVAKYLEGFSGYLVILGNKALADIEALGILPPYCEDE